jgi:SAM-dependent methyltransferase
MRWVAKAIVQKCLSTLPAGDYLNYVAQRHVTRSLPSSESRLRRRFRRAARHLTAYVEHGPGRRLEDAVFYEFGPGWELTEAIAFWCLGVNHHIVLDIRGNMRIDLVNVTLERAHRLLPQLEEKTGRELRDPGPGTLSTVGELEARFGIAYVAPRDARATRLPAESVDFVSSTSTLEHVPADDLRPLVSECRRLLRDDGLISCAVDLGDHFSYFDRGISEYNFLRFSERAWRILDSSLAHQNRLRYPDHVRVFEESGFRVLAVEKRTPSEPSLRRLAQVPVAPELQERYLDEELAVRSVTIIARPVRTGGSAHGS